MEEPPKYVKLAGSMPGDSQLQRELDFSVAFRAGAYEVFQDKRDPQAYRLLRLDPSAPRLRDCMGLIGVSFGCDVRRRLADLYVRISRTGQFKVQGLDAQLLGVVGRIFKGDDGTSNAYVFPGGIHVSVNLLRSANQDVPQLVIPEVELVEKSGSLEVQLDDLMRLRSRCLREGGIWKTM